MFEKVAETRPEIAGADENLAAARALLLAEIQAERRPGRARSARVPWIVAGASLGAVAAVTVGVLVVGALTAPDPEPVVEAVPTRTPAKPLQQTPTPTPEPPTLDNVLSGAASIAALSSGPVAGPGQYLKVEHFTRQLVLYSPDDPHTTSRTQATSGWVATSRYTSYIPGTPTDEWVDVFHHELQVVDLFGPDAAARSQEWLAEFSWMTEPSYQRYPGGSSTESPYAGIMRYPDMPRDPAALIGWIRGEIPGVQPGTEDMVVVQFLMQELQLGAAPADLRAAMYRALAQMPNGVIERTDGDVVTLGFSTYPPNERWDAISIDTRTATVISVSTTFGSDGRVVPDDVPNFAVTQTMSVVDSAP